MKEKVPAEGFDLDPLNTGRRRLCSMLDAPGLVKVVHVAAFSALGHSVRRLRSIAPIEMAVSAAAYIPQEKKKKNKSRSLLKVSGPRVRHLECAPSTGNGPETATQIASWGADCGGWA